MHDSAMRYTHDYLERLLMDETLERELERRIEAIVERKLNHHNGQLAVVQEKQQ